MTADPTQLHDYLDGDLDQAQRVALDARLCRDPESARQLAALARLEQLIRAGLTPARPSVRDVVMDRIRSQGQPRRARPAAQPSARRHAGRARVRVWPWWRAVAAAAAIAAVVVCWHAVGPHAPGDIPATVDAPVVTAASDAVRVDGTTSQTIVAAETLRPGATLHVGLHGHLDLRYRDGTAVTCAGGTAVTVADGPGKALRLEAGRLQAVVAHQPTGRPFVLTTRAAQATVVGTHLALRTDDTPTTLSLEEGALRFERTRDAASVIVRTGEAATVAAGEPLRVRPLEAHPAMPTAPVAPLPLAQTPVAPVPPGVVDPPLGPVRFFPADDPWNQAITDLPVAADSARLIAAMGAAAPLRPDFGAPHGNDRGGYHYVVVGPAQPLVPVTISGYAVESDPGPFPLPPQADAASEGPGGTCHTVLLACDAGGAPDRLYEFLGLTRTPAGGWTAAAAVVFPCTQHAVRPEGFTSACGSGLPILPGLVRYEEVAAGTIAHALRFTCPHTRRGYVHPASHAASIDPDPALPPMGARLRLRADLPLDRFPPRIRVIVRALQTYGMLLSDHGAPWSLSGVGDARWLPEELDRLRTIRGADFVVVDTGPVLGLH